jgi:hypothetical protein
LPGKNLLKEMGFFDVAVQFAVSELTLVADDTA